MTQISDSGRQRADAAIGRNAEAQRKATAKALAGRRSEKRLLAMMAAALARVEKLVAEANKLSPPPRPIACGPGCPFCCHVRLTVSPPELLLVADHLRRTWPAECLDALKVKLANLDHLTRGRDAEAREAMRLPCPMLVDNSCGIHEVRPTSCRAVASVDVVACRQSYDSRMAEPVPQVTLQLNAANGVGYGVITGLIDSGFPMENIEFIAGLRIALDTENAARRWLDGEGLFAPASDA
jgi:Fe-S-cluster containining protein